jgi:undecaprenyl diphosphate synthase
MGLLRRYLMEEKERCVQNGVRVKLIGRRDRLPAMLLPVVEEAEFATAHCSTLELRVAIDYSSRDALLEAARKARRFTREEFTSLLGGRDVDLLIRTSGEQRLSDFLLWECAYAELHFTSTMWPDFGDADLAEALNCFRSRERRYGGLSADVAPRAIVR